jgi:uncharacterized membrane protein
MRQRAADGRNESAMNAYRATLIGSTITTALMAGTYFAFVCAVMPGLARGDDATYVKAMNQINTSIQNPLFFMAFLGSAGFTGLAWYFARRAHQPGTSWIVTALGLYVATLVLTAAVNIPLNNRLARITDDFGAARQAFEAPWVIANVVRMLLCIAALTCLVVALSSPPPTSDSRTANASSLHERTDHYLCGRLPQ